MDGEVTVARVPEDGHMVQETAVAAAAVATAGIQGVVLARWDLSAGTVKKARRVLHKGQGRRGHGAKVQLKNTLEGEGCHFLLL